MHEIFYDELRKLKVRFMEMGINVSEQIYRSTKSFIEHDKELANEIVNDDHEINSGEIQLEKLKPSADSRAVHASQMSERAELLR